MMSATLAAFVLLQLSAGAPGLASQGRVEGTILRAGSNEPLIGVRVVLSRPSELNTGGSTTTTGAGSSINLFAPPPVPRPMPDGAPSPQAQTLPPPPIPPVMTGEAGKFAFSALEPGTYRLTGRVAPGHVAGSVACGGPPGLPRLGYGDMGAGGQVLRVTACDRLEFGLWLRPGSDEVELDAVSLEKVD